MTTRDVSPSMRSLVLLFGASLVLSGCPRHAAPPPLEAPDAQAEAASPSPSSSSSEVASADDAGAPLVDTAPPEDPNRDAGPYTFDFADKRTVYVVAARSKQGPQRLIAMLHGICNPPEYACGLWAGTSTELGFLVCPRGEGDCGANSYHAPTWFKPESKIDDDLELAIGTAIDQFPGAITRVDEVLCGFSRGAYMAVNFAAAHPGRWPYLVLNEASVNLSVPFLKKAGVRAVALIAGEIGGQIQNEKATAARLAKEGYPVKFWAMPQAGHWYSADIDQIMKEAIEFVTSVR